jgi:hypothetical protein
MGVNRELDQQIRFPSAHMDGRQQTEDRRLSISHTKKESAVCLDSQKPPSFGQAFSHCKENRRRVLVKETEE